MTEKLHFLYDGFLLIAELKLDTSSSPANSAPTIMRTYHWEPTQPVATRPLSLTRWTKQTQGGTNVYSYEKMHLFHALDLKKNVSALISDSRAYTEGFYAYDPFGNLLEKTWIHANENPIRFSSEYHDEALGLVYYNYRHYNPHDGRWINRDPIAEQGGANIYGFISNNTVNRNDRLGEWIIPVVIGILAVGGVVGYIYSTYKENADLYESYNKLDKAAENRKKTYEDIVSGDPYKARQALESHNENELGNAMKDFTDEALDDVELTAGQPPILSAKGEKLFKKKILKEAITV